MRSNVVLVVLLLLGCVMSFASPALPPAPTPASSTTPFSISEYEVDSNGLWTDHEIPLSDASMEAIRQATPATPDDIAAWNAEAEPGMQVQAVIEDDETAETETEPQADIDTDTEAEAEPDTEAEAESENDEQETAEPQDDLEITYGHHGRMILIPHSRNLMMRRVIMYLTRLISKLKARSPLARVELKLKIEPVTPTPTPTPTRPRISPRRPPPSLGVINRPRPVALRLVPSRAEIQSRRLLARCSMLLRMALKRLHDMRRKLIKAKMKKRRRSGIRGLRFPGRGMILFRSNNMTTGAPRYERSSALKFEIEAERNGTVTIIAPRVNANLTHSIIVINRGTIILLNRSRNNTFTTSIAPRPTVRRFPIIPARSHHIMTANENDIEHDVA